MSQDAVKIRALAVDDHHPILREGLAALIANETDRARRRSYPGTEFGS
jgi:hypothetical protein